MHILSLSAMHALFYPTYVTFLFVYGTAYAFSCELGSRENEGLPQWISEVN